VNEQSFVKTKITAALEPLPEFLGNLHLCLNLSPALRDSSRGYDFDVAFAFRNLTLDFSIRRAHATRGDCVWHRSTTIAAGCVVLDRCVFFLVGCVHRRSDVALGHRLCVAAGIRRRKVSTLLLIPESTTTSVFLNIDSRIGETARRKFCWVLRYVQPGG
jgi:hypothetical protein